jgi:hypothetical protein
VLNIISTITFAVFIISVIFVNEYDEFLYRGGMLLISLNAAILIACVCHPESYLGHIFSWKPLRWIGKRSYGIYLWHYPVIVLSTPVYEIGNPSYLRIVFQLVITLIIAQLSYRFIEMPIRKHGFGGVINKYGAINVSSQKRLYLARRILAVMVPLMLVVVTVGITNVSKGKQQVDKVESLPTEIIISDTEQSSGSEDSETSSPAATKPYKEILAIGDSIMLDIASNLKNKYDNITIDGKVGRQISQAIELTPRYAAFNDTNKAVIIELGTNAYFTDQQIDRLLNSFSKAHIYLVNVRVPRQWEKDVNKVLEKKAKEHENITLIDWYSAAINHPEYFAEDGVHLQPIGIEALTSLIDQALIIEK